MGNVIDIKSRVPLVLREEGVDLALLSVFYFTDEFSKLAKDLEEEVRHALVLMVYRYLVDAETHGDLELNEKGFTLTTDAGDRLKNLVKEAIKTEKIVFN
jgi:hypothetical protein